MKKIYQNPETKYTDVLLNTIVCMSVMGPGSQNGARAPERGAGPTFM